MIKTITTTILVALSLCGMAQGENVQILDYDTNNFGQVQLTIEGDASKYYLLTAVHEPNSSYESITSMTIGTDGPMIISEPSGAFPQANYQVTSYPIANPEDTDGDGVDDITEFNNMPSQAPLNHAEPVPPIDGTTSLPTAQTYSDLAVVNDNIPWAPFLNNQEFVKFAIVNQDSETPDIYFINSTTHYIHNDFLATLGLNLYVDDVTTGEIVYNPNEIMPNGAFGSYSFNYSFGRSYTFERTQRTFELLVANMPFLDHNLQHFIGNAGEAQYNNTYKPDYEGSRINVVTESDVFADVDFLPFNQAEGYGFFRHMDIGDTPGSRDVVLYDVLPNSLPRVGGIITSVIQTPLSHVNLRAIQDDLPNAYIKEPLMIDSIANLLDGYVYYKVEQDRYIIREATLEEVNDWYEKLRPTEDQIPERDLSITEIMPLDEIEFDMSTSFGAKCTNVATMRDFGFPEGTIPNGFGIPFYFYDEFMKFNGFYDDVAEMIADPGFVGDLETRIEMLKDFRKEIKDADMPQWMLDQLEEMHDQFPEGTSVRCRSSTNNEDLPGFSGAGLYTSKTQHPEEGHIKKSVKQVYASMWNFRAFDEREFYRVDHFIAAMGVLCHPNYDDEKSNGVGVSLDPIYLTDGTFYLNTQVGESLITNPEANSIPEEVLLSEDPAGGYFVLRNSNLVPEGELVMEEEYLDLMRDYLRVIHDEFAILYDVVGAEGFGMDIEYKVTVDDRLIIKQARPWVSFWAEINATFDLGVEEIKRPRSSSTLSNEELVTVTIENAGLKTMGNFDITLLVDGDEKEKITITEELSTQTNNDYQFTTPIDFSEYKDYQVQAIVSHADDGYTKNDTLTSIITRLYEYEGGITASLKSVNCGNDIDVTALVANLGEQPFSNIEIEVTVNGLVVETVNYFNSIPSLSQVPVTINISENLQEQDNEITLRLVKVNGQTDAVADNNSSSFTSDLEQVNETITFVVDPDNYPQENSWSLVNDATGEVLGGGNLSNGITSFEQDFCVDPSSCYTLTYNDSFGDGICCQYGNGSFAVLNSEGDTLAYNNGDFSSIAIENFCPNGDGCVMQATYDITIASTDVAMDGEIRINATNGTAPYEYSIDGGETFSDNSIFTELATGDYDVVVNDASGTCRIEETVAVGFDVIDDVDDQDFAGIKLYPNPTSGTFEIVIDESLAISGDLNIEIYNNLGAMIKEQVIKASNGTSKALISLDAQPRGGYIVRCYADGFDKILRVVKM